MKYWILTTEYPPAHGGGISTYCYFTAQMLAAAHCDVTVFVNDDTVADFSIDQQQNNIRIVRFNSNRDKLLHVLGFVARLSYAFAGIVKSMIASEGKPSVIEAQDYLGIAYYLTQQKHIGYDFLSGVPIVITLHSPAFIYLSANRVPTYRFPEFWTGEMEKQSIVAADALISPTQFMLDEVNKYAPVNTKQILVLPNPYATNDSPVTSFTRNKLVSYGKLAPQKGSFELLSYFKNLWDDGFQHPLHIIGGTDIVFHPELKTMGDLVEQQYSLYIKNKMLLLHGKIQPVEIRNALSDAHVVIVASIVDNLPYVIIEAMSLGKIVLASVQGGQREMIEDGVTGFLFSHDDPPSFGRQLKKILSLSDEQTQRIGTAAAAEARTRYTFAQLAHKKIDFVSGIDNVSSNHFPFLYQEQTAELAADASTPGLLSVVIPFYNMGEYIGDCIESVQRSTYGEMEILIVDDGSTEPKSLRQLELIRQQPNVKIIRQPNRGLAAARNAGAMAANGEYLAFLDADDKVAPSYYAKAIAALQKNANVFFAGCWVQYFENSTQIWPAFTPLPPYALLHNSVNSSSLVYKKKAFLAGGLNDKKTDYGLEDYESVIHMLTKGFNGVVLPEVLFYYRVRTGSMFRTITREKLLYSNKYIVEKHRYFYARYALPLLHLQNANGPGYLYDNPSFETHVSVETKHESLLMASLKGFVKRNEGLKKLALKILKLRPQK